MNRTEFIASLDRSLGNIAQDIKKDILYDYQEHYSIGLENGQTEEQISEALGDPKQIARTYKAECALKNAEAATSAGNVFRAVLAALGLGFFNLLFVLAPYLTVASIIISLFAVAFGIFIAGLAILLAVILSPIFPGMVNVQLNPLYLIPVGIGTGAFGALGLIGMYYLTKVFLKATLTYLKSNIRIISGRRNENV